VKLWAVNAIVREHEVGTDCEAGADFFRLGIKIKAREEYLCGTEAISLRNGHDWVDAFERKIPAGSGLIPAVCNGAAWIDNLAVGFHHQRAVRRVRGCTQR